MDIRSARNVISRDLRDFGFAATLYDLSFRAANHLLPCTVWNALTIDKPNSAYSSLPEDFQGQLLDADKMRVYVSPENDLDNELIDRATDNGDHCMAIFDGSRLASYGWYSNQPTDLTEELRLRFSGEHVYMYKGFTHNDYRGQRLHAIGMTLALQEFLRRGSRGIVSVVASNNFSSLKSCYRMGYRDFGKIYAAKLAGRYLLHHSKGCAEYGFVVEPKPATATRERTVVESA